MSAGDGFATWEAWLERYRAHLELEGLAPRTVHGRCGLLAKFFAWARELGIGSAQAVTVELLADYRRYRIQYVNERGGRDRAFTVNTHLLAMRDFFGLLVARGAAPAALLEALAYVREPKLLPKETLSHQEIVTMLERIPGDTPIHLRDRAMLEVLYSTGIRRQELLDLALADLDLEGGMLRVQCGKGGKGRMVPIGRMAVEWVRKYLAAGRPALVEAAGECDAVFVSKSGRRMDGPSVLLVVRRWAKAAGIAKRASPHMLRRSCATGMIRNRASPAHVKDLLGHEDFDSLKSYLKLEIVDLKDAHRRFHPREQDDADGLAGAPVPRA
jgi:integrase/recombinase XerD